jgi:ATP-dependent helicase/nuclease subunit A
LAQSLAVEGGRFLGAHRWLRALRAAAPTLDAPAAPGAVRLLTIHGAKGLEAHTVVLLDTHSPPSRASGPAVLVDWPGEAPHPRRLVFLARESRPPRCAAEALAIDQAARAGEELNALYVALTRAERRLVVSAFEPFQSSRSTTVWQRLQPLAAPLEAPAPAAPSQGEASDGAPAVSAWALPELPSHRRPSRADTAALPPAIAPAAMNDAGDDSSDDAATRLGLAVHRLLQWLPTPDAGFDWTDAHALAVSREFGLDAAARAQALALAARMRGGDAAWAWSADAVDQADNEVELHHAGQPLRCDRVVRTRADGTWWVLDFKTREHPGRDPALRAQLARYRDALRAAQPGAPVRAAFIDNQGRLIELPHAHPDFEADPPA